jgi:hypothetical protein
MLAKFNNRRAKRRFLMDASDRAVAHEEQIAAEREARLARVPYRRTSTPIYDQTRDTWGGESRWCDRLSEVVTTSVAHLALSGK